MNIILDDNQFAKSVLCKRGAHSFLFHEIYDLHNFYLCLDLNK